VNSFNKTPVDALSTPMAAAISRIFQLYSLGGVAYHNQLLVIGD
jgi:hypothetical protein